MKNQEINEKKITITISSLFFLHSSVLLLWCVFFQILWIVISSVSSHENCWSNNRADFSFSMLYCIAYMHPSRQNSGKSNVKECIFAYMASHIDCRFNKNSLLQCYFLPIFPAGICLKSSIFVSDPFKTMLVYCVLEVIGYTVPWSYFLSF